MTTQAERTVHAAPGVIPAAIAAVWTLVVLVGFAVLPFYSTSSGGETSDGTSFETTSEETIIDHEGTGVVAILLVPVAAALVGLAGAAFRIPAVSVGSAGIAMALCILGMASIGMFYLPAGILLVVAAVRAAGRTRPPTTSRSARRDDLWLSFLVAMSLSWAIVGAITAVIGFRTVNPDAQLLVGAASLIGPAAAVTAAILLMKGRPRLAGLALLVSVATPTYAAWVLNVPALCVGVGLLAVGRPVRSDG